MFFLVVLSLDIEMLDWNMVKTKTLSWKKKWKACSLSLKEMFRICNLAVKHIFFHCCRMIQMQKITNGHAQWEYWPLENFKGFYISKKWLQNCNKIEKQLTLNHFYRPYSCRWKVNITYMEVRCSPLFSILGRHFTE